MPIPDLAPDAVRFSPENGEIEVGVSVDDVAGRVIATVKDRGPGVSYTAIATEFSRPFFSPPPRRAWAWIVVASRIADLQKSN